MALCAFDGHLQNITFLEKTPQAEWGGGSQGDPFNYLITGKRLASDPHKVRTAVLTYLHTYVVHTAPDSARWGICTLCPL